MYTCIYIYIYTCIWEWPLIESMITIVSYDHLCTPVDGALQHFSSTGNYYMYNMGLFC